MRSDLRDDGVHLLTAVAQGDRRAFEHFYDQFSASVFTLALRILGAKGDAEDLVQEVFLQAWRRAEDYRPDLGKPKTWLLTIARNRALDRLRSAHRMKSGIESFQLLRTEESTQPKLDLLLRKETQAEVHAALSQLSREQRLVLELAYFEGLTQTEIASRLGEPLGTVKTRIRLGLERLRRALAAGHLAEVCE
jgi:RNA polymerase sigma-70 factor, ECF subfamily